jgi:hypothetical protein
MGWLRAAVQSVDTALLPTWALLGLILLFGLSWSAPEASTRLLVSGAGLVLGAILASLVLWLVLALIPQIPGTVRGVPVPWASGLQEVYRFGGVMALSFGGIGLMFMVGGRVMRRKRAVVGD